MESAYAISRMNSGHYSERERERERRLLLPLSCFAVTSWLAGEERPRSGAMRTRMREGIKLFIQPSEEYEGSLFCLLLPPFKTFPLPFGEDDQESAPSAQPSLILVRDL